MAKNITELKLNELQNVTGGYGVAAQPSLPQLPTKPMPPTSWPAPTPSR